MDIHKRSDLLVALAAAFVQLALPAHAQYMQAAPAFALQQHAGELREDAQKAGESSAVYETYRRQVSDYVDRVERQCAEAHIQRLNIQSQYAKLQKQLPQMAGQSRIDAWRKLADMKVWLDREAAMDAQAARNIETCDRWLRHTKDQANIDNYNAAEDQQAIADEQTKIQQAQQLAANETRKAQDRAYWQAQNNGYYGGGGGYYPHVRGWGHHYGHYSHGGGHVSGGGGHVSHMSFHGHR